MIAPSLLRDLAKVMKNILSGLLIVSFCLSSGFGIKHVVAVAPMSQATFATENMCHYQEYKLRLPSEYNRLIFIRNGQVIT